jgi:NAD(P)-dependent dehydrogenase (short-subunit alcohol dehydrogenase family)
MIHDSMQPGRVAVITGAASGIGFAAASRMASMGMRVCLADTDARALAAAAAKIATLAGASQPAVLTVVTDVANLDDMKRLQKRVEDEWGPVAVLMNNAAVGIIGRPWSDVAAWKRVLDVNLWGVINGLQCFVDGMIHAGSPSLIINVGSKQGITTPPGNAAYNVAKAGVKVLTEQLAHDLRQLPDCATRAHLLVPGFTHTGMTTREGASSEKPAAAWSAAQVVEFMMQGITADQFYILCPDNQTSAEMDRRRIQWSADDLILGRPALSRWHPDYAEAFKQHMEKP